MAADTKTSSVRMVSGRIATDVAGYELDVMPERNPRWSVTVRLRSDYAEAMVDDFCTFGNANEYCTVYPTRPDVGTEGFLDILREAVNETMRRAMWTAPRRGER